MAERPPIEIAPPDLAPYRAGNTGVDYVHVLHSGQPGANVMVQALTHGNEFSGAIALDTLWKDGLKPARGTLTIAFANVAAYERFELANPGALVGRGRGTRVSLAARGPVGAVTAPGATPNALLVRATGAKRRKLNSTGKVKVKLAVTYTPTGGSPSTQSVKLKLKKKT